MVDSVLHHILECEANELQFCTIRLYYLYHFFLSKTHFSHISAFAFFIVMLKHFFGVFVLDIIKIW